VANPQPGRLARALKAVAAREPDPDAKQWLIRLAAGDRPAPKKKRSRKQKVC
jgi:hypothetical protein